MPSPCGYGGPLARIRSGSASPGSRAEWPSRREQHFHDRFNCGVGSRQRRRPSNSNRDPPTRPLIAAEGELNKMRLAQSLFYVALLLHSACAPSLGALALHLGQPNWPRRPPVPRAVTQPLETGKATSHWVPTECVTLTSEYHSSCVGHNHSAHSLAVPDRSTALLRCPPASGAQP
jgi:hypothetical protein